VEQLQLDLGFEVEMVDAEPDDSLVRTLAAFKFAIMNMRKTMLIGRRSGKRTLVQSIKDKIQKDENSKITGYMSEYSFSDSPKYTTNFLPPTAPLEKYKFRRFNVDHAKIKAEEAIQKEEDRAIFFAANEAKRDAATVLPADEPKRLLTGWTVYEEIGICCINCPCPFEGEETLSDFMISRMMNETKEREDA